MRGLNFCQKLENIIICPLFGPPNPTGLFFKNQAVSLPSCKKKKKNKLMG